MGTIFFPALYFMIAVPIYVLWKFMYRWNVALVQAFRTAHPDVIRNFTGKLGSGSCIIRNTALALEPRWCVWVVIFGALFSLYSIPFFGFDSSRPRMLLLHEWALLLSIGVTAFLTALSGSLVLVHRTGDPKTLRRLTALFCVGAWVFVWLVTPSKVLDWSYRHTWLAENGTANYWEMPLFPLALPVCSAVLLVAGVYRLGAHLRKEGSHADSTRVRNIVDR